MRPWIVQIIVIFVNHRRSLGEAPAFSDGVSVGSLSPEIFHASGLAASQKHDEILYTHNDGDDVNRRSPIIYAISATSGGLIARLRVFPATNKDWEDIAVGPCGNTTCIYVLDKSANTIYRVQEPDFVYSDQILSLDSKVEFIWHHRKSNTLMVDNKGFAYIIAVVKGGGGRIGRVNPDDWGHTGVDIEVRGHLNVREDSEQEDPQSGDISADGQQIVILTRSRVYFWNVRNGDVLQTLADHNPAGHPPLREHGSDGICWDRTGQNYYTVNEIENAPLYLYRRHST